MATTIALCHKDGTSFKGKTSLYNHNKINHNDGKNVKVSCGLCNKTFPTKRDLTIHMTKDKHNNKTFNCSQCDKSFTKKANLKTHIEATHDKKQFCCAICGKPFSSKQNQKFHYSKCKKKQEKILSLVLVGLMKTP